MPEATSRLDVVNLEVMGGAADLAVPIIPRENLPPKILVGFWSESYPRLLWLQSRHVMPLISSRNSRCFSSGINPYSLCNESTNASGFPSCKFAHARKSAQIISRQ